MLLVKAFAEFYGDWIFRETVRYLEDGTLLERPGSQEKKEIVLEHARLFTAFTRAVSISSTSRGFFISAEPSPLFTTLGTGQPMLKSIMAKGRSWTVLQRKG